MARRIGRWAYSSESTRYGEAGWHLDGSPVVIDFMPGLTDGDPGRGLYLGYNWPGRDDGWVIARYLSDAMRTTEQEWDESPFAVTAGAAGDRAKLISACDTGKAQPLDEPVATRVVGVYPRGLRPIRVLTAPPHGRNQRCRASPSSSGPGPPKTGWRADST